VYRERREQEIPARGASIRAPANTCQVAATAL